MGLEIISPHGGLLEYLRHTYVRTLLRGRVPFEVDPQSGVPKDRLLPGDIQDLANAHSTELRGKTVRSILTRLQATFQIPIVVSLRGAFGLSRLASRHPLVVQQDTFAFRRQFDRQRDCQQLQR